MPLLAKNAAVYFANNKLGELHNKIITCQKRGLLRFLGLLMKIGLQLMKCVIAN